MSAREPVTILTKEGRVITIGVDAHKRLHVALAVGETGQEIDHWRGPNSAADWQDFMRCLLAWSGASSRH